MYGANFSCTWSSLLLVYTSNGWEVICYLLINTAFLCSHFCFLTSSSSFFLLSFHSGSSCWTTSLSNILDLDRHPYGPLVDCYSYVFLFQVFHGEEEVVCRRHCLEKLHLEVYFNCSPAALLVSLTYFSPSNWLPSKVFDQQRRFWAHFVSLFIHVASLQVSLEAMLGSKGVAGCFRRAEPDLGPKSDFLFQFTDIKLVRTEVKRGKLLPGHFILIWILWMYHYFSVF